LTSLALSELQILYSYIYISFVLTKHPSTFYTQFHVQAYMTIKSSKYVSHSFIRFNAQRS